MKINKKTRMKLAIGILLLFMCIAVICVIFINKRESKDSQSDRSTTNPEATSQLTSTDIIKSNDSSTVSGVQTTMPALYTNKEFGFTLNFNEEWNDYTVSRGEKKNLAGFVDSLEFKLPDVPLIPLTIYIFDKQSDESVLAQLHATFISKSSNYIYGYSTWESLPSESVKITDKSIANLIATFQLI